MKTKTFKELVTISMCFPKELLVKVDELAEKKELTRSDTIRQILKDYLEEN